MPVFYSILLISSLLSAKGSLEDESAAKGSVLIMPLTTVGKARRDVAKALDAYLVTALQHAAPDRQVFSYADIGAMLSVEKAKDVVGCDNVACSMDFAGALGANNVIYGSVVLLGSKYNLTLAWVRTRDGKVLRRSTQQLGSDLDAFDTEANDVIRDLLRTSSDSSPEIVTPVRYLTETFERHYDLYGNGKIVGCMRLYAKGGIFGEVLEAKVSYETMDVKFEAKGERKYNSKNGLMDRISYHTTTPRGNSAFDGRREGNRLLMDIGEGPAKRRERLDVKQNIGDEFAIERLLEEPTIGRSLEWNQLDLDGWQNKVWTGVIEAMEERKALGQPTVLWKVRLSTDGYVQSSWYDMSGRLIEGDLYQGILIARLTDHASSACASNH